MARPIKVGLDYFPLDVDAFDDPKIIRAEEVHGEKAGYIAIRLLCCIYREGYFIAWDQNAPVTYARKLGVGLTSQELNSIVQTLIQNDFFNARLYHQFGILTSRGIQKRYQYILSLLRRKLSIPSEKNLINDEEMVVSSEETKVNSEESTPTLHFGTQKKRKEKKVNNPLTPLQGDGDGLSSEDVPVVKKFKPPTQEEVTEYFTERQGGKWTPEDIAWQAIKWFERYTSNGWMVGRTKMKDWRAAVRTWISNDYDGCNERCAGSSMNEAETPEQLRSRLKMVY